MICLHCGNEIIKESGLYAWVHKNFGGLVCPSKENSDIIESLIDQKKDPRSLTVATPKPKSLGKL